MKKLLGVVAALVVFMGVTVAAQAQYGITSDVIFVRLGYSSLTVESDSLDYGGTNVPNPEDIEGNGFNVQGEYNLNLTNFLIGFGLEYTYMKAEIAGTGSDPDSEFTLQFLAPYVSAKFLTAGGFYIGAGLSGKYLVGQSDDSSGTGETEWDKKIDLWGNLMLGFIMPVAEYYYVDVQGRFGYNLTNNQFESADVTDGGTVAMEADINAQYDFAIYVGFGFRAVSTGL
ncbi:MAG TPA: hypothetical protein PK544_04620 [Spirochaetota bacterium]|nr:hypothetical protein [Spirochaetota bacterium]HPJ40516.1 hypothetical protein [Spirochaetota bacterium]HPQ54478.1 hypothetical protein [Spirochaetota bacterium]